MFRIALIALALVLAFSVSGHAQGVRQEPVRDPSAKPRTTIRGTAEAAGNLHKDQHALNPPAQYQYPGFSNANPVAFSCNIPGLPRRTILVPAGKNPMDFCPASAIAIYPPISNDPTPPANWHSVDMEQDNIAKDELRALELRNKTPGQQTSGQPP